MADSISKTLLALYEQMSDTARSEFHSLLESQRRGRVLAVESVSVPAKQTHRATGRIVFANPDPSGVRRPIHNVRVELWDRDFGADDFLAAASTDHDGRFEIWYDPADAGWNDLPDLEVRVYDWDHHYDRDRNVVREYKLIERFVGPDDVTTEDYDFGELQVALWEYDPEAVTPRLFVPEQGAPPQSYPPGRAMRMVQKLGTIEVTKRKHLAIHAINSHRPTLADIQADYPEPLTIKLERERPGYTRTDEYFAERILNGMSASILDRDPRNPNRLWLHHHWNSYEQDSTHAMPNVDVWFELRDGLPIPVEIKLQFRVPGREDANAPLQPPIHVTPADGDRWLQAKRAARVSAALHAELEPHLSQTHLNVEQYAIACYRNLRANPVRMLLHPHTKEVVLVNREANGWLLGDRGYIARSTAFRAAGVLKRIRQSVGGLDWKNWQPRRILSERHMYAKAAHAFWQVLTDYVDWYFEQHRAEIEANWFEVHRFSNDLVEHSVPLFLCAFLQGWRDSQRGKAGPPLGDWFEPSERIDLTVQRVVKDGVELALTPITHSDTCDEAGWENLKQVCRYVIYHATFAHNWSNSRQFDDGGELVYNGLGLRMGENGIFAPESDPSISPPPDEATEQIWFACLLARTPYGFLLVNEEHDIHPHFIELLRQRSAEFAALGLDLTTIQSRINI